MVKDNLGSRDVLNAFPPAVSWFVTVPSDAVQKVSYVGVTVFIGLFGAVADVLI